MKRNTIIIGLIISFVIFMISFCFIAGSVLSFSGVNLDMLFFFNYSFREFYESQYYNGLHTFAIVSMLISGVSFGILCKVREK